MSYRIEFLATRPNTDVPFFYDAPEHAEQMASVDLIREEIAANEGAIEQYSKTYGENQLSCKIEIVFGDPQYWHMYMTQVNTQIPRGIINRNLYFLDHEHTLVLHWLDGLGGEGTIVQVA